MIRAQEAYRPLVADGVLAPAVVVAAVVLGLAVMAWAARSRRAFGTVEERATYAALHQASLAAPALRTGLHGPSAATSARHLRALLGSPAVTLTDTESLLVWEGAGQVHAITALRHAQSALSSGRPAVTTDLVCGDPDCQVRAAVVAPLVLDERVVGTVGAYGPSASPGLVSAVGEVARWVSGQLELAELDESRSRLAAAQVRALRAQDSPHFIFNALPAVAPLVRTDPARALRACGCWPSTTSRPPSTSWPTCCARTRGSPPSRRRSTRSARSSSSRGTAPTGSSSTSACPG